MGLVARAVEAAGIPTVVLSSIWSLQKRVGMPRVAAIEFPMGRALGDVGERALHRQVFLDTLAVFETAPEAGWVEPLPYKWPDPPEKTVWLPDPPPPYLLIVREKYLEMEKQVRKRHTGA